MATRVGCRPPCLTAVERLVPALRVLLLMIALVVLAGCAGRSATRATIADDKPAWAYGNHCGGNYPSASLDPPAADDLDLVCRFHDQCYAAHGGPYRTCDALLRHNVQHLRRSSSSSRFSAHCKQLFDEVMSFAALPDRSQPDKVSLAFESAGLVWQLPALAFGQLTSRLYRAVDNRDAEPCMSEDAAISFIAPQTPAELAALKEALLERFGPDRPDADTVLAVLARCHASGCAGVPVRGRSAHPMLVSR